MLNLKTFIIVVSNIKSWINGDHVYWLTIGNPYTFNIVNCKIFVIFLTNIHSNKYL